MKVRTRFVIVLCLAISFTALSRGEGEELGYITWPPVTLKPADLNLLPVDSLAKLIKYIRTEEKLLVLIFKSLPDNVIPNPELLAIPNSELEQAAVDQMIRDKSEVFSVLEGRVLAQYLPPFLKNGPISDLKERPHPQRALLTLGRSEGRLGALHEFLHHRYQSKVYPLPIRTDGKFAHPYNNNFAKFEELNRRFERIEAEFNAQEAAKDAPLEKLEAKMVERMQSFLRALQSFVRSEREPQIEEIRVWFATFFIAKRRNFEARETREALHKLWSYLVKWNDFIDKNLRASEMLQICAKQNRSFLKQDDLRYLTWLESVIREDQKSLSEGYAMIAQDLLDQDLQVDLKDLADRGRARIAVKEGKLNIEILEETELFLPLKKQ